jgi:hypothetical protein
MINKRLNSVFDNIQIIYTILYCLTENHEDKNDLTSENNYITLFIII